MKMTGRIPGLVGGLFVLAATLATSVFAKDAVLVIGAHPDDEVAMAGTLYLMKDKFDIHVAVLTRGDSSFDRKKGLVPGSKAAIRTAEEENESKIIGYKVHWLDYVDGSLYATPEACADVAALIREVKPRAIFAMWPIDRHLDHTMAGTIALKGARLANYTGEFYYYEEVWGSKGFVPAYSVDVTHVADIKQQCVRCHVSQNGGDSMNVVEMHGARSRGYQAMYVKYHPIVECFAPLAGFRLQGQPCIFTELPPVPEKR